MAAAEDDDDIDEGNFFEANLKLERSECLRKESSVRFNYYSIEDNTANAESDTSALMNRKGSKAATVASANGNRGHDPLKWFGVLVPQTLRQSAGGSNSIDIFPSRSIFGPFGSFFELKCVSFFVIFQSLDIFPCQESFGTLLRALFRTQTY